MSKDSSFGGSSVPVAGFFSALKVGSESFYVHAVPSTTDCDSVKAQVAFSSDQVSVKPSQA